MSVTVQTITSPKILLTGVRVLPDGSEVTVTDLDLVNETRQISTRHFKKNPYIVFNGPVTVKMTSVYPLKSYGVHTEGDRKFVGTFNDSVNVSKAEIHYNVNGSDPLKEGIRLYKKPFVLKHDVSNDTYVIRAKVSRQGKWSDVTKVSLIVK